MSLSLPIPINQLGLERGAYQKGTREPLRQIGLRENENLQAGYPDEFDN